MAKTEKLYWQEPYRKEFDARVVSRLELEGRPAVALNATCFYPTSGGQPNDLGRLSGVHVLDVVEQEGQLLHVLEAPLDRDEVRGEIDWQRRFDHMQQHSGQHIVSRAFEDLLEVATVSFHLGSEESTIDVAVSELTRSQIAAVERLANRVVMEDRPVTTLEVTAQAAERLPLRKEPQVEGPVRIVRVEDFDDCACGGTHVARTGEIGCIHVTGVQNQKGNLRVTFLCGWRALGDYARKDEICQRLGGTLSVGWFELEDAVTRLLDAEGEARHRAEEMRTRWVDAVWPTLVQEADSVQGLRVVCHVLDAQAADQMRYVAHQVTSEEGRVALLGVREPSPQICFARSEDVDIDMGQLLRDAAGPYGGRGGGRPQVSQGGGMDKADLAAVLRGARSLLEERLASKVGR